MLKTGPGAPIRTKIHAAEPDNIVLLLCRQESEYFVMDVRLKDDPDCTPAQRMEHIQQSLRDGSLLDLLGNIECVDVVVLSDLSSDFPLAPESRLPTGIQINTLQSRPSSHGSSVCSSTFMSFMTPLESSRPVTGDDAYSASDEAIYQLLCDAEWMLTSEGVNIENDSENSTPKLGFCRPATAISLMKLPNGSRPMLIIPKSRPASAEMLIKDIKYRVNFESFLEEHQQQINPTTVESKNDLCSSNNFENNVDKNYTISTDNNINNPKCLLAPKRNSLPIKSTRSSVKRDKNKHKQKKNEISNSGGTRRSSPLLMHYTDLEDRKSKSFSNNGFLKPMIRTTHKEKPILLGGKKQSSECVIKSTALDSGSNEVLHFLSNAPISRKSSRKQSMSNIRSDGAFSKSLAKGGCMQCKKKLGPAQIFHCKCNKVFCATHRYSDRHSCTHDYKAEGRANLVRENPCVKKDKVVKIE